MAPPYTATFGAYDSTPAPLTGLTPTWSRLVVAATGVVDPDEPDIEEMVASSGFYGTAVPAADAGVVYFGSTASPKYRLVPPLVECVFLVLDRSTGEPVDGLTFNDASWGVLVNTQTGASINPNTVSVVDLGGGLYRVDGLTPVGAGRLTIGGSYLPPYCEFGLIPDAANPALVLSQVSPVPPSLLVPTGRLVILCTDPSGLARTPLLLATLTVDGNVELVHDGTSFGPRYRAGSGISYPTDGQVQYSLVRAQGFPINPRTGQTTLTFSAYPVVVE